MKYNLSSICKAANGYIPAEAAPVVAVVLDGNRHKSSLGAIVGGYLEGMRLGLRLRFSI